MKVKLLNLMFVAVAFIACAAVVEVSVGSGAAFAQEEKAKPKRKTKKVQSIRQKLIKTYEKINEAFDAENIPEVNLLLAKLEQTEDLNNVEKAYIANYRGNIFFSNDNLNGALGEFKKILGYKEGLSDGFYNQIMYVIAQVYFSQENYSEALTYAQRWFKLQEDPSADAFMLIGQAQYMLKRYDQALPNVQKGIQKYIDIGSVPKESWLNLLSNIYRQKSDYKKMLPVLKQLVLHYPKKMYLLTIGGVYNELNDPQRMTAVYGSMYDQGLLTSSSELVTLASLLLSQDNPYKASLVMEKGLGAGILKKNLQNYQIYSQALYIAKDYEKALEPLEQAASRSPNGKLYNQLGQSFIALNRWKEADGALSKALKKGKLQSAGQTLISQGLVRFEQQNFKSAKVAFKRAAKIKKVAPDARKWIKYVDSEVYRLNELKKEIVINTDVDV